MEMNAVVIHGPQDIRIEKRPWPKVQGDYDAVVRVTCAGICGSELHPYRGHQKTTYGHIMVSARLSFARGRIPVELEDVEYRNAEILHTFLGA